MSIKLEKTIKRFIGESGDLKPKPGLQIDGSVLTATDLPVGSTLYLADLGLIERWDGIAWRRDPIDTRQNLLADSMRLIQLELAAIRLGMIDAGTCRPQGESDISDFALT